MSVCSCGAPRLRGQPSPPIPAVPLYELRELVPGSAAQMRTPESNRARSKAWRQKNPDAVRANNKAWRAKHPGYSSPSHKQTPDYFRRHSLFKRYGTTPEQEDVLFLAQGKKCYICGCPSSKPWCIDHDHVTGQRRKILCNRCNLTLGAVNDDTDLLRKLIKYIEEHDHGRS